MDFLRKASVKGCVQDFDYKEMGERVRSMYSHKGSNNWGERGKWRKICATWNHRCINVNLDWEMVWDSALPFSDQNDFLMCRSDALFHVLCFIFAISVFLNVTRIIHPTVLDENLYPNFI